MTVRPVHTGDSIRFDLADWCRLLAHACTIYTCGCACHAHNTPGPSTALHTAPNPQGDVR